MRIPAVLDTACLIGLERIGELRLLPLLLDPVLVPSAVVREFGALPTWASVEQPCSHGMIAALRLVVDPGEAEAITLAFEKGVRIILDDRKAREAAQRLGIPVTGTVGLLIKAKLAGLIPAVRPLLDSLDACQFRISTALREEALKLTGE